MTPVITAIAKHAAPLAVVVLLAGCSTLQPEPEPVVREAVRMVSIHVASSPPNTVIEYNNEVVGVAPCVIKVPATPDGRWQSFQWVHVLRASMTDYSDWEAKEYNAGAPVPEHVVFRLPDAQRKYMALQRAMR